MRWLALLPLAIWLYLLAGRGRFWATGVRLPPAATASGPRQWPPVAVVVPARDEADLLPATLPTLLAQDYPGAARVILVDDCSTDGTTAVATALAAADGTPGAGRVELQVVGGAPRPDGWAGKLWAVHQGVGAATTGATDAPTYLLLTDADIAHPPDSLRRLVTAAEAGHLDQVSLMARLRTGAGWERLLVPAFVYFFAQLYPFRWVSRPGRATAAAAGGCILVRTEALARAGGIAAVHDAVIDDVALARALKASGSRVWLGLADDVVSTRAYPHLGDLWDMVARSAFTQLRHSTLLLVGTVAGLAVTYLGAPAALVAGLVTADFPVAAAGATAWLVMAVSYIPMLRYYRLSAWRGFTLPFVATLYAVMTLSSAWRHWRGGVTWKGRRYG